MVLGRRLLVLMAVLLGLTALAAALAPRPTVSPQPGAATASPAPRPSAAAREESASRVVAETVDVDVDAGREGVAPVRARAGDTVRLVVRGDVLDAVEIQGLDEIEPIEPGSPARFEFRAEAPGRHPILLQAAERRVGLLDIRPGPGG